MALEDLSEKRIDIRDLTLETQTKTPDLAFDPRRDITDAEWQSMADELEGFRISTSYGDSMGESYISQAAAMKLMFPGRMTGEKLDIRKIREGKDLMLKHISRAADPVAPLLKTLADLKTLAPEIYQEIDMDDKFHARIERQFAGWLQVAGRDRKAFLDSLFSARDYKIIFPERMSALMAEDRIYADWGIWKKWIDQSRIERWWPSYAEYAAAARIVFPAQYPELGIGKVLIGNLVRDLHVFEEVMNRSNIDRDATEPYRFTEYALNIHLLSVKELNITERGIDFGQADFQVDPDPLPTGRKF